jgi:hypothetical protein
MLVHRQADKVKHFLHSECEILRMCVSL